MCENYTELYMCENYTELCENYRVVCVRVVCLLWHDMNVTCKWFLSALTFTITEESGTVIVVVCLLPTMTTSMWSVPIIEIRCRSCSGT